MNKRFIYGIVCIILAAVIAFGGIPLLASQTNAKIQVVKVSSPVNKGTVLTADSLSMEEVGAFGLAPNAVTKIEDVVGKYAATDLVENSLLLPGNISDTPISTDSLLSALPSGKVAVSVSIKSLASGLSDKLQSGDIIRIYHFKDTAVDIPELQYVRILSVTDEKGSEVDKTKSVVDEDEQQQSATIVVEATPEQALRITDLENDGNIHVALIYRGNKAAADKFIAEQDKFLKKAAEKQQKAESEAQKEEVQ